MTARKRNVKHSENFRTGIDTARLVRRLVDHARGKIKLEPTQMRAIEILPVDERRSPNERGSENRGRGRGREGDRDEDKPPALGEQGGFKHGQKRIV